MMGARARSHNKSLCTVRLPYSTLIDRYQVPGYPGTLWYPVLFLGGIWYFRKRVCVTSDKDINRDKRTHRPPIGAINRTKLTTRPRIWPVVVAADGLRPRRRCPCAPRGGRLETGPRPCVAPVGLGPCETPGSNESIPGLVVAVTEPRR